MKRVFSFVAWLGLLLAAGLVAGCSSESNAQDKAKEKAPAATAPDAQVKALIGKVEAKLQQGKDKESDFASELKEFDALITRLKADAPDAASEAAFMRALLYVQVLENPTKGADLMRSLTNDFPKSKMAKDAEQLIVSLERQEAGRKIQATLVPGAVFPDFKGLTDMNGKPLNLAAYKGKVVLVDFWATWCGPCREELPNVLEVYNKYHPKGFEIVGISLDDDKAKLTGFIKENKMTWQQYMDADSSVSEGYGISGIPAVYLLDGEGKILARDLYGEELKAAVAKAMAAKK